MKCPHIGCKEDVQPTSISIEAHFRTCHKALESHELEGMLVLLGVKSAKNCMGKANQSMTKERFVQILRECGITNEKAIESLWEDRPFDTIDEALLRKVTIAMADAVNKFWGKDEK